MEAQCQYQQKTPEKQKLNPSDCVPPHTKTKASPKYPVSHCSPIWIYRSQLQIFLSLVRKYRFCVNLIQKLKRVILRRNLVPTLRCLIDAFSIFFHSGFFSTPVPPAYELLGKGFNSSLKGYTYADLLAISQKVWPVFSVFCFASFCKEANRFFLIKYKEANLLPIIDLISQK